MFRQLIVILTLFLGTAFGCKFVDYPQDARQELRGRAIQSLRNSLHSGSGFLRIHSAEALIALGYDREVLELFYDKAAEVNVGPILRVGYLRVLYLASSNNKLRQGYLNKLVEISQFSSNIDQVHAVETLCKLRILLTPTQLVAIGNMARSDNTGLRVYSLWLLHLNGDPAALDNITELLSSKDPDARALAAYAIRYGRFISPIIRTALQTALSHESKDSPAYPFLLSACVLTHADNTKQAVWVTELQEMAAEGEPAASYEAFQTLMKIMNAPNAQSLKHLLGGIDDKQIGAAWTILEITRK